MGNKQILWGWKAIVEGVKDLASLFWKLLNPSKKNKFNLKRKNRKSRRKNESKFKKRGKLIIGEIIKKLKLIFEGLKQLPREIPFIRFIFVDRKKSKKSKNSSKTKYKSTSSKTAKNKTKSKDRKRTSKKKSKKKKVTDKTSASGQNTIKNNKRKQKVTPVREVQKAGERFTISGRIKNVKTNSKNSIQQQGLMEDDSGEIKFTLFADAGQEDLSTGKVFRLENVFSNKYATGYAVEIDEETRVACLTERKAEKQDENIGNGAKKQSENNVTEKKSLSSAEKSFKLYRQDKTVSEIAEERGLKETTIYGHLTDFLKEGKIQTSELIDSENKNRIESYLKENELLDKKRLRLRPIKEELPDEVSYDEIRCVLAEKGIN